MLTDQQMAALLRLAARELANTLAPAISGSYPSYVARALATVLQDIALRVDQPKEPDSIGFDKLDLQLGARLGAVAKAELALLQTELADLEQANRQDEAAIAAQAVEVTPGRVDACLALAHDLGNDTTASLVKLPGGFSKETYLVSTVGGRELVLRRDLAFGPVLGSAADEAGLIASLSERGFPVPRVWLSSHDLKLIGRPFLLVERVAGENAGDVFRRDSSAAANVALGLARTLGQLHALDPGDLGVNARGKPTAIVRDYISSWRQYWLDRRLERSAIIEATLDWLLDNVPEEISSLVVVHGDARPDNMMARADGTITALLDWEFFHAGDAAEDVEYAINFVGDAISREAFLHAYAVAGGVPYSQSNATYHAIWRAVRNLICLDTGWSGFVRGRNPVFSLGVPRILFRRDVMKDLATSLQALDPGEA